MLITRKSVFTGNENSMDIAVTHAQLAAWNNGGLIQQVMPRLTPDEREFLMTGATPEEWEELFGEDE